MNDHAWIRFNFKSWITSILFLLLLFEEALIEWHISQIREFKFQPESLISFLASFEFKGTQDCNCCIGGNLQLSQFWSNWHWSIPKLIVFGSGYNSVKMSRALLANRGVRSQLRRKIYKKSINEKKIKTRWGGNMAVRCQQTRRKIYKRPFQRQPPLGGNDTHTHKHIKVKYLNI